VPPADFSTLISFLWEQEAGQLSAIKHVLMEGSTDIVNFLFYFKDSPGHVSQLFYGTALKTLFSKMPV
jgi:hypothetical protein